MTDVQEGFEQEDLAGSSGHYNNGSVISAISVPTFANKVISEFYIENMSTLSGSILQFSLDGGTSWKSVDVRGFIAWTPKGRLRQIKIRSKNGGAVSCEMLLNFEDY